MVAARLMSHPMSLSAAETFPSSAAAPFILAGDDALAALCAPVQIASIVMLENAKSRFLRFQSTTA